jgi:uncharacterized membrane protein
MLITPRYRYAWAILVVLSFQPWSAFAVQSGSISGKVKARSGKALSGVLVTASRWDDATKTTDAMSGEKGEFEVTGLKAGEYVIRLEKSGYRSFTSRRVKLEAGDTMKLRSEIELVPDSPPFAIIRGAVFSADGFSLPNASLTVERLTEGKKFKRETTSVDGGEFTFKLPAEKATYRVTANAKGFESASKEVEVDTDEVRQIALSLQRSK